MRKSFDRKKGILKNWFSISSQMLLLSHIQRHFYVGFLYNTSRLWPNLYEKYFGIFIFFTWKRKPKELHQKFQEPLEKVEYFFSKNNYHQLDLSSPMQSHSSARNFSQPGLVRKPHVSKLAAFFNIWQTLTHHLGKLDSENGKMEQTRENPPSLHQKKQKNQDHFWW